MIANIIATLGVFIGIMYTVTTIGRLYSGEEVYWQMLVAMSLGWTMVIAAKFIF